MQIDLSSSLCQKMVIGNPSVKQNIVWAKLVPRTCNQFLTVFGKKCRFQLMVDGKRTFTLPRLVGLARAMEIVGFDKPISSKRAL